MKVDAIQFLTAHEVCSMLRISRSTLYRLEKKRLEFPKRCQVGPSSVRWLEHELSAWMRRQRVAEEDIPTITAEERELLLSCAKGDPHEDPS
tara:strand:+ start:199 stop:474 length:276 start_codon:yes stop_codon:yes gene_type:complete